MSPNPARSVLVADPKPALGACLADFLRGHGLEVRVVRDAGAAVAALRGRPFDLAILDTELEETGGMVLCARLCAARRADPWRSPAVIVTGPFRRASRARKALALGAEAYLPKPYTPDEIGRLIGVESG